MEQVYTYLMYNFMMAPDTIPVLAPLNIKQLFQVNSFILFTFYTKINIFKKYCDYARINYYGITWLLNILYYILILWHYLFTIMVPFLNDFLKIFN